MTSLESRASSNAIVLEVMAAADKDIGGREHDEDGFLLRPDLALFAVADGAGGENAGNVASSIALASLARHFEATQKSWRGGGDGFDRLGLSLLARRLSAGVHRASREVLEIARSADRYRGMGTTVVAVAADLDTSVLHVAHVGDSRCYRLRAGRIELLTQDHSLAQDVLELSPEIDDEKAAKLPQNVITRALGMSETVRVSVRSLDIALGDVFVLCTDGLTDVLSDEEIAEILLTTTSVRGQVAALLERAREVPAEDNVAVAIVRFEAPPGAFAFPKRHATRPHPTRPPSAPAVPAVPGDSWHDPEIVLVDIEPDDDEPTLHIVSSVAAPASVPPSMLSALHDVVGPKPRKRFPRPSSEAASAPPGGLAPTPDDDGETVTLVRDDDD